MSPNPSLIAAAEEEADRLKGGGDLTKDFYYLAGPMSNLPAFNFPAFHEAADVLRENGYNIVNPAELDHEIARVVKENEAGSHKQLSGALADQGVYAPTWAECLKRDIEIVADDRCVGVILIDGWEQSQGAQFETYVAYKLLKPIYKLSYEGSLYKAVLDESRNNVVSITGRRRTPTVRPTLVEINRREALTAAGVID